MQNAKSHEISKFLIMDAFKRVKANHGSAGIDGVSIELFEKKSQRQSVQNLEPHEFGKLLPSIGQTGRNT